MKPPRQPSVLDLATTSKSLKKPHWSKLDWWVIVPKAQARKTVLHYKKIAIRMYGGRSSEHERNKYLKMSWPWSRMKSQYQLAKFNKAPNKRKWATTPSYSGRLLQSVRWTKSYFQLVILQFPIWSLCRWCGFNDGGIREMGNWSWINHAFDIRSTNMIKDGNVKKLVDGNDFSEV